MSDSENTFVAKVHPLSRAAEPEDPFELMASPAIGDPLVMLECLVQEFIWLGWSRQELLSLFHHPGYPVLCELQQFFGPAEIERQVDSLLGRSGQLRFQEFVEEPDDGDEGPELVQIQSRLLRTHE